MTKQDMELKMAKINRAFSQSSTLTVNNSTIRGSDIFENASGRLSRSASASSRTSTDTIAELKKELASADLVQYDFNFAQSYPLHAAIRVGRLELIKKVLNAAKSRGRFLPMVVNEFDDVDLMTPLHYTAKYNHCEAAILLLNHGAMINSEGHNDETALHTACRHNNFEMGQLLISKGSPVQTKDKQGLTPLHIASLKGNRDLVDEILHQKDIDVNVTDQCGTTPLHLAARSGDEGICQLLILFGASKEVKTRSGNTPLHMAAAENHVSVMEVLLKDDGGDVTKLLNESREDKQTALHLACRMGYVSPVRLLLEKGMRPSIRSVSLLSPLHLACIGGHYEVAKLLLSKGAVVNAKDENGVTPAHIVAHFGHVNLFPLLLENDVDTNVKDKDNSTPLMTAIAFRQTTIVEFLLFKGSVDISAVDVNVRNCLHLAVQHDNMEVVTMLMKYGASALVQAQDKDGRTPVHYAAFFGRHQVLEQLVHIVWDFSCVDFTGKTPLHLAAESGEIECVKLLTRVITMETLQAQDSSGSTALHLAADLDHWEICNFLLGKEVNPNIEDETGQTSLHRSVIKAHSQASRVLLQHGADIECQDHLGDTPLLTAVRKGCAGEVQMMLEFGASVRACNNEKQNCLEMAVERKHEEICLTIINHNRWRYALTSTAGKGQALIRRIIAEMPEVMGAILDNCVTYSGHDVSHSDFHITYNFDIIDPQLDRDHKENLATTTMVEYGRNDLLLHPLTRSFLTCKWRRFGHIFYTFFFAMYACFAVLFTSLVILERDRSITGLRNKAQNLTATANVEISSSERAVAYTTLSMCLALLVKQAIILIFYRHRFFVSPGNMIGSIGLGMALPVLLHTSAIVGMNTDTMFKIAIIDLFIVWIAFTVYLKKYKLFRGYITMYLHVTVTLLKVLLVFSSLFVMFMVSFYLLFVAQDSFNSLGKTIAKVLVMQTGELDYESFLTQQLQQRNTALDYPFVPFEWLSYVFVLLFVFMMIISLMNLLIGLAVGDIDGIKRTARVSTVKQQVDDVAGLDRVLPLFIRRRIYVFEHVVRPNRIELMQKMRFYMEMGYDDDKHDVMERYAKYQAAVKGPTCASEAPGSDIQRMQQRLRSLEKMTEEQTKLLRKMAALPQLS